MASSASSSSFSTVTFSINDFLANEHRKEMEEFHKCQQDYNPNGKEALSFGDYFSSFGVSSSVSLTSSPSPILRSLVESGDPTVVDDISRMLPPRPLSLVREYAAPRREELLEVMSRHGFCAELSEEEFDELICYLGEGGIEFFDRVLTGSCERCVPSHLNFLKHFQNDLREAWIKKEIHAKNMAPPDLDEIIRRINIIDAVRALRFEADTTACPYSGKIDAWRIEISPDALRFAANCDINKRRILLCPTSSQTQALGNVAYEYTNAGSSLAHHKLEQRHDSWQISTNAFTRLTEKIEFEGGCEHHKIIQIAADAGQLTPIEKGIIDEYRALARTGWTAFWKQTNKDNDHAEYYREDCRGMQEKSMQSMPTRRKVVDIMKEKELGFCQEALDSFNGPELQAFEEILTKKGEERLRAYLKENSSWLNRYRDSEGSPSIVAAAYFAAHCDDVDPAQHVSILKDYDPTKPISILKDYIDPSADEIAQTALTTGCTY